jgi:hypothetical protein
LPATRPRLAPTGPCRDPPPCAAASCSTAWATA